MYLGEMYDARKEQENWDRPGFTDNQWKNCIIIPGPAGKLTAQAQPPISVTRILKPKNIYELKPGDFYY